MHVATRKQTQHLKKRVGYVAPTPSSFVTDADNVDGFDCNDVTKSGTEKIAVWPPVRSTTDIYHQQT